MNEEQLEYIFGTNNTTLSVIPFRSYLLNVMELDNYNTMLLKQMPDYAKNLDYCAENGYAYCVIDSGKPVLCFGISPQWYGVAELWLIPDINLIKKYRIKFHKGTKKFMDLIMEELNLHRIHVTVLSSNINAIRWIESISFKREGVLEKYTFDKKDMIMYSRLEKER